MSYTFEEIVSIDKSINERIEKTTKDLAVTYIELAEYINKMRVSNGFFLLGFRSWEHYITSKNIFSKSLMSALCKLGGCDLSEVKKYLPDGMIASKLVIYAALTSYPEKIPQLMSETWYQVKQKSVRETRDFLTDYTFRHAATYLKKTPIKKQRKKTKDDWKNILMSEYHALSDNQKVEFKKAVLEILASI